MDLSNPSSSWSCLRLRKCWGHDIFRWVATPDTLKKKWPSQKAHLSIFSAWISYKSKLWPGLCYGLATLSTSLCPRFFEWLLPSGATVSGSKPEHQNRSWCTPPRAFGGINLFSAFQCSRWYAGLVCWSNIFESLLLWAIHSVCLWSLCSWSNSLLVQDSMGKNLSLPLQNSHWLLWAISLYRTGCIDGRPISYGRSHRRIVKESKLLQNLLADVIPFGALWQLTAVRLIKLYSTLLKVRYIGRFTFPQETPTHEDWSEWAMFWASFDGGSSYLHNSPLNWIAPSPVSSSGFMMPVRILLKRWKTTTSATTTSPQLQLGS